MNVAQCPYCKQLVTPAKNSAGQLVCTLCNNTGRPAATPWAPAAATSWQSAGALPREKLPTATTALVMGILAIVIPYIGFIFAFIAMSQGRKGLELAASAPGRYEGEGMAKAGRILGIVALILYGVGLLIVAAAVVFVLVSNLAADGNSTAEPVAAALFA